MTILKRIISVCSTIMCITIIWIPIHFAIKTGLYGDKREISKKEKGTSKTNNL